MGNPSSSLATLRPDLAGAFEEFTAEMASRGFIGNQVLAPIDAGKPSGVFGRITLESLLRSSDTLRAMGSEYNRDQFEFEDVNFACQEHGFEYPVDDRRNTIYAEYFDSEMVSARLARDRVVRNYEIRCATAVFNATTWTGSALTTAVTNEWDDAVNAKPVTDVHNAAQTMRDNSGMTPNALIINERVYKNLRLCSQIKDDIASSGAGESNVQGRISVAQIAQALDLERIIIAGQLQNTGNLGAAASLAEIWSNEYAMVCRVANPFDPIDVPCIGRTLHYSEDGSEMGGAMETYRDEKVRGDVVRCRMDTDELIIYPQAGHLLSNITT